MAAGRFCSDAHWVTPMLSLTQAASHGDGRVCKPFTRRAAAVLIAADKLDEAAVFLVLIEKCKLLVVEGFEEVVP